MEKKNVKYIKSLACPNRCIQEGITHAVGEYCHITVEDSWYPPDTLNIYFDRLNELHRGYKDILTGKYLEGVSSNLTHLFPPKHRKRRRKLSSIPHYMGGFYTKSDWKTYNSEAHWTINYHPVQASPFIPAHWNILHCGIMKTEYFIELGGLDCQFQCQALAHTDLAVRAQRDGATIHLLPQFLLHLDNTASMPKNSRIEHGPIILTQINEDQPLYRSIYDDPACINRIRIDFDNWKNAPEVWDKRDF